MVSYIHSEITIWLRYSFITKSRKSEKQSNIFKIKTPFLNLKLEFIRLAQRR